ncbi:MAG: PHP-associated domain-containing protein [Halobacteriales archaeon]
MTAGIRVDPHVKVLDESVVERAKARGLDALVYAPHFTRLPAIRSAAERYTDDELVVVPGREVFTGPWYDRKHVLALDLEAPVPDFVGLAAAFDEFRRQDAVVLVPHPDYLTVSLDAGDVDRHRDAIHAVETYNPKHWPRHNRAARRLARRSALPAFGSSYAHLPGTVGEVWTAFPGIAPDAEAIVEAFRSGADRTVHRRSGAGHQLRCAAEVAHLFYENTYAKLDRVVLSGTEATHPSQPAYGGRFTVDRG